MSDDPWPDVRPNRHVRATITEAGAMLLDLRGRGRWYALPPSGGLWWQHVAAGIPPLAAADLVAARYNTDPDIVRADMRTLHDDLRRRGHLRPARRRWR